MSYGGLTTVTKYHLVRKDEHVVDSGGVRAAPWSHATSVSPLPCCHPCPNSVLSAAANIPPALVPPPPTPPPSPPFPRCAVFMHDNFRRGLGDDMVVVTKKHVYTVEGDDSDEEE